MPQSSPNLDLPFIQPAQAQKHVTHNEALRRLDIVVQLSVQQVGATNPPATPEAGEIHAIGTSATGAWSGQDNMLAAWLDEVWHFIPPQVGWRAWNVATDQLVIWDGSIWNDLQPADETRDRLGIQTTADDINRLSVSAAATLLSHDGTDHRLTVNKATPADTASLLFQSGFDGRAEMGLTGEDDFTIKVSDDGTTWTDALTIDAATGLTAGTAVQSTLQDGTEGRLMRVGAFGLGEARSVPLMGDIDATDSPTGWYQYTAATTNSASLPAVLQNSAGVLRIERYNASLLIQTAWRNNFNGGLWMREHAVGSWGAWRMILDHTNILGTVSQTGGQPTGALIERGAGVDGTYLRFADGTQICTHQFDTPASSHTWTFPVSFTTGVPPVVTAMAQHDTAARIVTTGTTQSETGATFSLWDTSGASAPARLQVMSTGRWF